MPLYLDTRNERDEFTPTRILVHCIDGKKYPVTAYARHGCGLAYHEHLHIPNVFVITHLGSGKMLTRSVLYGSWQAEYVIHSIAHLRYRDELFDWFSGEEAVYALARDVGLKTYLAHLYAQAALLD